MRRNDSERSKDSLDLLAKLICQAEEAPSSESLLGIEGVAAETYFSRFENMLKTEKIGFSFENRNRRPPKDPVNAVLSYLYPHGLH